MLLRLLCVTLLLLPGAAAGQPREDFSIYGAAPATRPSSPEAAGRGPYLFIDDQLIESSRNLARAVNRPERDSTIRNPLVTGKEDRCFQPFFTVMRDAESGRFRLWYGAATEKKESKRSRLAYMTSPDGIHWQRPARILDQPAVIQFGSEVLDRGPGFSDPSTRYVYSYYLDSGLRIAVSPDGLAFRPLVDAVVLPHDHDVDNVSWDDLRRRYVATVSTMRSSTYFGGRRRTTMQSFSDDLIHWSPPNIVLSADSSVDQGETQFYAMNGFITRGAMRIGMVKVLRDDVESDSPDVLKQRNGGRGTGYTALAWTRDGVHWVRDPAVFFDRGPVGAWDRSHAWIDEQLIVGEKVYLYYAGYRSGHKTNRFEDRQIGLVTMPLDRYVARQPSGRGKAYLKTVALKLPSDGASLDVNANAAGGAIRVQVSDAVSGAALAGFTFDDCLPLTGDGLWLPVRWKNADSSSARGKTVRIEFEIDGARLYAFDFHGR